MPTLAIPAYWKSGATDARLRHVGALLKTQGVRGLFEAVQQMADLDVHYDQYPRMKARDDATGVYLRLSDRL
jgi:hypothetical protein